MRRKRLALLFVAATTSCFIGIDDDLLARRRAGGDDGGPDGPIPADARPTSEADAPDSEPFDPCSEAAPMCPPVPSADRRGSGLTPIDRCAFPFGESADWATAPELIAALEGITTKTTLADVLGDLDRTGEVVAPPAAPAGVTRAFRWDAADTADAEWIPQGMTGTSSGYAEGTIDGKRVLAVTWSHTPAASGADQGVRVAFTDVTTPVAPRYRYVLLGKPNGTKSLPSFEAVRIAAGGIAWYGNLLFVAETQRTVRVFDLRHIVRVDEGNTAIGCAAGACSAAGYRYVLLEVGAYTSLGACLDRISFVALDRSTSPPSLLAGEYCTESICASPTSSRLLRWPLDGEDGRWRGARKWPSEAYFTNEMRLQSVAANQGVMYLSASALPASDAGSLLRLSPGKRVSSPWVPHAGGLLLDAPSSILWGLSEGGDRTVIAAGLASYPPS